MTPRETKLAAALDANVALRVQAERLIAAYVAPESGRAAIINEPIGTKEHPPSSGVVNTSLTQRRTMEVPMFFQTVSPLFAAGEVLLGLSITMFVGALITTVSQNVRLRRR